MKTIKPRTLIRGYIKNKTESWKECALRIYNELDKYHEDVKKLIDEMILKEEKLMRDLDSRKQFNSAQRCRVAIERLEELKKKITGENKSVLKSKKGWGRSYGY